MPSPERRKSAHNHQYCPKYFVKKGITVLSFKDIIQQSIFVLPSRQVFVASVFARDFVTGYRRYALYCLPGRGTMNLQKPPLLILLTFTYS
jgi:hypothetical protein